MESIVETRLKKVPVLLLAFNRPLITQQVLARIATYSPPRLYVAVDGPRSGHPTDEERCSAVKQLVADWRDANPATTVHTLYQKANLGCGRGVSSGITWFFDQEEMGIILEDDCLPSGGFFWFCEQLLWQYRDQERIMHIGGCNFLHGAIPMESTYYFSKYPQIWGWASWRRAWSRYRFQMSDLDGLFSKPEFHRYYKKEIFELTGRGELDTWDIQWIYAFLMNDGLSILPNGSFIENIGFGEYSGAHLNGKPSWYEPTITEVTRLIPPPSQQPNVAADDYVFRTIYNPGVWLRAKRKIRRLLSKKL
jgi:hypothetical protein